MKLLRKASATSNAHSVSSTNITVSFDVPVIDTRKGKIFVSTTSYSLANHILKREMEIKFQIKDGKPQIIIPSITTAFIHYHP